MVRQSIRADAAACALVLAAVLAALACTPHRMYRPESIQDEPGYRLAYIEFDDQGDLWSPVQVQRALDLIDGANETADGVAVVVFVHGWNNNASEQQEQTDGKSLHEFKRWMSETVESGGLHSGTPRQVIGVFMSWRGQGAKGGWNKLTFYNRRRAANRVAGVPATETLARIIATTKRNPGSRIMLVGHSFGGLIVERLVGQAMAARLVELDEGESSPGVDLVVLINPASPALNAKRLVEEMSRERIQLYNVGPDGKRYERPLLISVTSENDTATKKSYPAGRTLGSATSKFREFGPEYCSPGLKQKEFIKRTAGHLEILHSHDVVATELPESEWNAPLRIERDHDQVTGTDRISFNGYEQRFTIERKPLSLNDTPYWIMGVPASLIPDHSRIFGPDIERFVATILSVTGAMESSSSLLVTHESGVEPIDLAPGPGGTLLYLDRSRRLFGLSADSPGPSFMACIPAELNPEQIIGVFGEGGDYVVVTTEPAKDGFRTKAYPFSLATGGYKQVKPVVIETADRFWAAAGSADTGELFLATESEIRVVDVTQKSPRAVTLTALDLAGPPTALLLEPRQSMLLALDGVGGKLYVIDPAAADRPAVVVQGLGEPTALAADPGGGAFYVADAAARTVWRIACDAGACGEPVVFARHDAFVEPSSLEVTADGTLWVGDRGARDILALSPEGELQIRVTSPTDGPGSGRGGEGGTRND